MYRCNKTRHSRPNLQNKPTTHSRPIPQRRTERRPPLKDRAARLAEQPGAHQMVAIVNMHDSLAPSAIKAHALPEGGQGGAKNPPSRLMVIDILNLEQDSGSGVVVAEGAAGDRPVGDEADVRLHGVVDGEKGVADRRAGDQLRDDGDDVGAGAGAAPDEGAQGAGRGEVGHGGRAAEVSGWEGSGGGRRGGLLKWGVVGGELGEGCGGVVWGEGKTYEPARMVGALTQYWVRGVREEGRGVEVVRGRRRERRIRLVGRMLDGAPSTDWWPR